MEEEGSPLGIHFDVEFPKISRSEEGTTIPPSTMANPGQSKIQNFRTVSRIFEKGTFGVVLPKNNTIFGKKGTFFRYYKGQCPTTRR